MGRRQSVVDQPRHRPEHGAPVLARIRLRVATAVLRVPDLLRQQNSLHAAEIVQSHVQDISQGRQVRPELLRVRRGARKTDRQQLGPAQLLSVPQVSVPSVGSPPPKERGEFSTSKHPSVVFAKNYRFFSPNPSPRLSPVKFQYSYFSRRLEITCSLLATHIFYSLVNTRGTRYRDNRHYKHIHYCHYKQHYR